MVAPHQAGQRIQESFGAVQRVYVKLRFVLAALFVRVKHHGGNMQVMSFRANEPSLRYRDGVRDHNRANVACMENLERCFSGRHWYDPVSGMRQNRIADGSQHPFCGNRKDCWTHIFFPSTDSYNKLGC